MSKTNITLKWAKCCANCKHLTKMCKQCGNPINMPYCELLEMHQLENQICTEFEPAISVTRVLTKFSIEDADEQN